MVTLVEFSIFNCIPVEQKVLANVLYRYIFGTIHNLLGGMLLFPEDESGESSQQEEEESEAGTDEPDNEEYITEEQLERRR